MRLVRAALVVAVLAIAAPADAHDFWLYPSTHHLQAPGTVDIRIFYGLPTDIQEFERRPSHFKRFEARAGGAVVDTYGKLTKPAGHIDLPADAIYTLYYESTYNYIELDAEKFQLYLADEGLTDILAERAQRKETTFPGNEAFARYVKALIKVGNADTGYDRKIGMASELVALRDPFAGGAGGQLEFQLWFLDKPAANAVIDLFAIDDRDIKKIATAKSDAQGKVTFATPPIGRYMVTGTTMRRAAYPVEADWESFWTSITFEVESTAGTPTAGAPAARWGGKLVFAGVLAVLAAIAGVRFARRQK